MDGAGEDGVVESVSLLIVAVPGRGRKTLSDGAVTFSLSVLEYVQTKPFCSSEFNRPLSNQDEKLNK